MILRPWSAVRLAVLALACALLPASAGASLTGLGEVRDSIPELSTALPRELPGPCEGALCDELEEPQPKTRVRGFELDLYCRLGGEGGLSCTPRRVWAEEYGEGTSDQSLFTGHYFDTETNLYYAKARYFDPELGRFLSQDSYLGELTEPPSLHRYLYAHDRPTFYVDPDGHAVSLAEAAARERARRAQQKERVGEHSYTDQGSGCGSRCEQEAYYKEQERLHPAQAESVRQPTGQVEEPQRSLFGRFLRLREEVGDVGSKGGKVLFGKLIDSTETDEEYTLQKCGGVQACVDVVKGKNIAHGLDETAQDVGAVAGRETGTAAFDYATAKAAATVLSLGGAAIAKAAEGGAAKSGTTTTPWGTRVNATGRFGKGPRGGLDPVDDFIAQAKANGYEVLGREVSFKTPFETRRVDLVLRDPRTGKIGAIEIKSSAEEFAKLKPEQFAADRWINRHGAQAVGENARQASVTSIDHVMKIQWPPPPQ